MKKNDFVTNFLIFSFCAAGLFHEFIACIAGIVLCIYLCVCINKNKKLSVYINISSVAVCLIVLFYGISCFWALDSGIALFGFLKFLPLFLFLIVLMQQKKSVEEYFEVIPYIASIMTFVSAILMQIPALTKWFSVAGRLSGFFQYSNTFAIFLLMALIILATKENHKKIDLLLIPVILFGIVYSGSRTVFVLMLVSVMALIVFNKNKKYRTILFGGVVVVVGFAVLYATVTDNFSSIGRFLTLSLKESTFVGRLLYFQDALPVILKNPFGMGYLGYHYYQHSIQTGVYTVKFIHNDFLQLMLDIGWIPVIIFVIAILKSFFKKDASLQKRLLILVVSAHTCFDFNFQYVAIFMLFVMLLDYNEGTKKELNVSKALNTTISIALAVLFTYIGTAQALTYFKNYEISNKLYPWNTENHMAMLSESSELSEKENLADQVIKNNGHLALAYDIKAKIAYSKGDFAKVIEYKEKSIEVSPFTYSSYEDYCYMLINGIYLYEKYDDEYSANVCKKELLLTVQKLSENNEKLSKLGKMIKDQPKVQLPDEIIEYVEEMNYEK